MTVGQQLFQTSCGFKTKLERIPKSVRRISESYRPLAKSSLSGQVSPVSESIQKFRHESNYPALDKLIRSVLESVRVWFDDIRAE